MAFFGGGDGSSFFGDPTSMGLLGAIAGLGQYAGSTRMPVTMGQALGGAAGGLIGGVQAGSQYQLGQQELTQAALKNVAALDALRRQAAVLGTKPPSLADVRSGQYQGLDWVKLFDQMQQPQVTPSTAPQLPTAGAGATPQQPAVPGAQPSASETPTSAFSPALASYSPQGGSADQVVGGGDAVLPALTRAIHHIESRGQVLGVKDSTAGAVGPMQVMPDKAAEYGVGLDRLRDPKTNLALGSQIVSDYYRRYNGDPEAVAVAYNAGPGRADKWLESGRDTSVLPKETQGYLGQLHQQLPVQYAQAGGQMPQAAGQLPGGGQVSPSQVPLGGLPQFTPLEALRQQAIIQALGIPVPKGAMDYLGASALPPGKARELALSQSYNEAGIKPYLGGERAGVPLRQYNPQTGGYEIVGQTPIMKPGELLGPNYSIMNAPGSVPAKAEVEAAQKWAGVPPALFEKGIQATPQGGVAPVPGYPQAQGQIAGTKKWAEVPANMFEKGLQTTPEGGISLVPGMTAAEAAQATAKALGPSQFRGHTFYDEFGRPYQGTEAQLPSMGGIPGGLPPGATGAAPPSQLGAQPPQLGGLDTVMRPGGTQPGSAPPVGVTQPGSAPPVGGTQPGSAPPVGVAAPAQLTPAARPEAAAPTFPVATPTGPKDVSQVRVDDLFPGGQGVPHLPAPPAGLGYGPPGENQKEMQKANTDQVTAYGKELSENQKVYQDLAHLKDILQRGLSTGKLAPLAGDMFNIAHELGADWIIPKGWNPTDIGIFTKAGTDLIFAAVKKLAGQVRVAEIEGYSRASPNVTLTPEANMSIINDLLAAGKWQDARARLAGEFVTQYPGAPLTAFNSRFNEAAPLQAVTDRYKQAMVRVAGADQPGGAAGAPASTTKTIGGTTYHKVGDYWYPEVK